MIKIINILIVFAFLIAIFIIALRENNLAQKSKKRILWASVFFLSLFFGARDFGLDLEPYRAIFTELSPINLSTVELSTLFNPTIEPVFTILISIIKNLGLNYQTFLLISAAISFFLVATVIQKNSATPILCLLFFCLLFLFKAADAVRHFMAASIYLFSLHLISRDKSVRGHILIAGSCLAHYSNLIILLLAPFLRFRWNLGGYMVALAITIALAIPLGQMLSNITTDNDTYLLWKFNYYLHHELYIEYQNKLHEALLLFLAYFYFLLIICINFYILAKLKNRLSRFEILILNSQLIGSLVATFFFILDASTLATRILLPLAIGSFFLLAKIFTPLGREQKNPPVLYATISALLTYNFVVVLYNAGIHYYKSPFFLG